MRRPWAEEEMEEVDLGDERLNNRLIEVLSAFADHPQLSIPAACGGLAETAAAYRLFDNEQVSPEKILEPHFQNTRKRIAEQSVTLMVQDTTEADLTRPEQQVRGAGPLDVGSRQGCFLHPVLAFTPSGVPLGAVAAKIWARTEPPEKTSSEERRAQRRVMPFEEKESFRWLEGFQTAQRWHSSVPKPRVCVSAIVRRISTSYLPNRAERFPCTCWYGRHRIEHLSIHPRMPPPRAQIPRRRATNHRRKMPQNICVSPSSRRPCYSRNQSRFVAERSRLHARQGHENSREKVATPNWKSEPPRSPFELRGVQEKSCRQSRST